MRSNCYIPGLLFLLVFCGRECCRAGESLPEAIDRLVAARWAQDKIQPAPLSDDPEFARRLYLDLVGRIPTGEEVQGFCTNPDLHKRSNLIDELLASGEFVKEWRENLNLLWMGGPAFGGNPEWRSWLEDALRHHRGWDTMARDLLRALPERPEDAGASHFLASRFAQGPSGLDLATRDISRFFFGVDIQCARCHKHPEVDQWKQASYWGMAAFWNRSYPLSVKGQMRLAERADGEVEYSGKGKVATVAQPVFLTGEKLIEPPTKKPAPAPAAKPSAPGPRTETPEDPADFLVPPETAKDKTRLPVPKFSRRAKLVELAINDKTPYFKRAAVNYFWSQLLGRGLVEPRDQMHDANPPSHPELLQFLADDFAAHQFDIRYLLRGIANSRAYQLTSRWPAASPRPSERTYAAGSIRPLAIHQLALSLVTASGYRDALQAGADPAIRSDPGALRAKLEAHTAGMLATLTGNLDSGEPFQPGIREALFQANSPTFADFLAKGGLAARLANLTDDDERVREAFWSVLSRPPVQEESDRLKTYLHDRPTRRLAACEQLVWALVTCAEFRFNH